MKISLSETTRKSSIPRSTRMRVMGRIALVLAAMFLWLPSVGRAQSGTHTLTCGPEKTIGQAIKTLKPGDTLLVSGTCNENLAIGEEVQPNHTRRPGAASINGDSSANTVTVTGRGITIRGFVITGGAPQAVNVTDGGYAVIDGNTIQYAGRNGIAVFRNASAEIINNTIQNNPLAGIVIQSNSSARIGWVGPSQQQGERAQHDSEQWDARDPGVQRVLRPDLLEHHPEQRQPRRLRGPERAGRDRGLHSSPATPAMAFGR